jgi:catechol 2,3-dioxygenase
MADHAVSESIYLHDPDYNGIEVYIDRPTSEWAWNGDKVRMVTEPLDAKGLVIQNPNGMWAGLPSGTTIGHVHLNVANLNRSRVFYRDVLGLYHTACYPGAYFFAADRYHHHVATNTWIGTNILTANTRNKPGLDHYAIVLPNNKEEIGRLEKHFANSGIFIDETPIDSDMGVYSSSFCVSDPDGIKIQFVFD